MSVVMTGVHFDVDSCTDLQEVGRTIHVRALALQKQEAMRIENISFHPFLYSQAPQIPVTQSTYFFKINSPLTETTFSCFPFNEVKKVH
jgi:hypothetical protein